MNLNEIKSSLQIFKMRKIKRKRKYGLFPLLVGKALDKYSFETLL